MKHPEEYQLLLNNTEEALDRVRDRYYLKYKPFVEAQALACGIDMFSHQGGLTTELWPYPKDFENLQNFINELSDAHKIDYYFQVVKDKIKWFD